MIIAVDASTLTLLINPDASPPIDPATGSPVAQARERIELFINTMEKDGGTILLPTPTLAEVLVAAEESGPKILEKLQKSARFRIADFDQRSAVEVAAMTRDALRSNGTKKGNSDAPWQKVKMDRQIIAISKVNGAEALYSDDRGISNFAINLGLKVIPTWQLPAPPPAEPDLFSTAGLTAYQTPAERAAE